MKWRAETEANAVKNLFNERTIRHIRRDQTQDMDTGQDTEAER